MGRPAQNTTPKRTDFHSVDLAWLRRQGAGKPGWTGTIKWSCGGRPTGSIGYRLEPGGLRLNYRHTSGGSTHTIAELISIVTTPLRFGGFRHWFACPSCSRRCRIVYGGAPFRCRLCRGARYDSQYSPQSHGICDLRWQIRDRLEERLGCRWPGGLDGFPPRPPRMHWATYLRLKARDDELAGRWCISSYAWLQRQRRGKMAGREGV